MKKFINDYFKRIKDNIRERNYENNAHRDYSDEFAIDRYFNKKFGKKTMWYVRMVFYPVVLLTAYLIFYLLYG